MDEKIYSVTLADGSTIDNLTLNGNNYVSKTKIDKSIFDGNCHSVMISDGESEVVYENMECVQVTQMCSGNFHLRNWQQQSFSLILSILRLCVMLSCKKKGGTP